MKTRNLLLKLSKKFPKRLAKEQHDFIGLMAGKLPEEVNKILLCLDFDEEVLPKAIEYKPDLILTHHPFIYGHRSQVLKRDPLKKELVDKVEALGLCVYSMHTNFDIGRGGMNDALANALELKDIEIIPEEIMMRGGKLEKEMTPEDFAKYANKKLNVSYSVLINAGKPTIKSVAIVGGAGSGKYYAAQNAGYDIYISGDIPHHVRRDIIAHKYNYLDMPHEIEKIFIPAMKKIINELDPSIDILMVDHEKEGKVIC